MTRVIALVAVLGSILTSQPQTTPAGQADPLVGHWVLVTQTDAGKPPTADVRFRSFDEDHEWYVVQVTRESGAVSLLWGGTETLTGNDYVETVTYADPANAALVNQHGTFAIEVKGNILTMSRKLAGDGSAAGRTVEVWRRLVDNGPDLPSTETVKEIELRQGAYSTPSQNLAGAYINNHYRLGLLALAKDKGNLTLYFGGQLVTPSNEKDFVAEYQHREEVYAAEIRRRGVPTIAGAYSVEVVQPCPGDPQPPVSVDLQQNGFEVVLKYPAYPGEQRTGAVAGGYLTLGEGDYDPNNYAFGAISPSGRIELRAFSGAGCTVALTRRRDPA